MSFLSPAELAQEEREMRAAARDAEAKRAAGKNLNGFDQIALFYVALIGVPREKIGYIPKQSGI